MWDQDHEYPVARWRDALAFGETTLGYWEWVAVQRDASQRRGERQHNPN
jgi:hypothetical protein